MASPITDFDQVYRTIDSFLWSRLQNQREAEYVHYYYVTIARSQPCLA